VGITALEWRNAATPVGALLVEGAGALALAVAVAAGMRLTVRPEPGEAVSAALGVALLPVLIFNPPPRSVPLFPLGDGWAACSGLRCWLSQPAS